MVAEKDSKKSWGFWKIIGTGIAIAIVLRVFVIGNTDYVTSLPQDACDSLRREITYSSGNNNASAADALRVRYEIYAKSCNPVIVKPVKQVKPATFPVKACEAAEAALSNQLNLNSESEWTSGNWAEAANIYLDMADKGCAENADKNKALALRAYAVADAMAYHYCFAYLGKLYLRVGNIDAAKRCLKFLQDEDSIDAEDFAKYMGIL